MIKSIKVSDLRGNLIFKLLAKKSGEYEFICENNVYNSINIEARNENGCKIYFNSGRKEKV